MSNQPTTPTLPLTSRTSAAGEIALRFTILTLSAEVLELEVEAQNLGQAELILFNRAPQPGGSQRLPDRSLVYSLLRLYRLIARQASQRLPDRSLVYSYLDEEVLHLAQWVPPLPEWTEVLIRIVPHLTRLPPGTSCLQTLILAVPVPVWDPYQPARDLHRYGFGTKLTDRPKTVRQVKFSLGYSAVTNPQAPYPVGDPADQVFGAAAMGQAVTPQRVISSEPLDLPLRVLVREP